jgi:hypothetical protein
MKQKLLKSLFLLFAFIAGFTSVCADTKVLTFDLSKNPGGWPTTNSTTLTNYTYTLNEVDYTFALKNVKSNSGYLMLTSTAVLGLPAIEGYKLTKVEATNSGGCSTSTKVGISSSSSEAKYISGGAIQTWSVQGSTYTYDLTETAANTMYYMYVTNKNAQVVTLKLTYESNVTNKEERFSYVDYKGWANSPDYGKLITMPKTDVDITNNWFYTPQGYSYVQFTSTNGNGTITITPKNNATITKVEFAVFAEYNGYQNEHTITPSTGTVSKNEEGTIVTWEGEASSEFTLSYKSHIRWTSIVVTYTGGLPTCETPVISGETPFLTYTTVSISCATSGALIEYSTSTDGVNYTPYTPYSAPFQISETTMVKARATKEGLADSKEAYKAFSHEGAVPNIATFVSTGVASQYLELHDALVTYKNGTSAYLQDASGAIYLYQCAGDLEAGDKLNGYMHVTEYDPSYNGLPEITGYELVEGYTKTSGNTVTPTVMTLSQLMGDPEASPYSKYLSKYIKIENATVTSAFSGKNCTIEQGGYTITLRDNGSATLTSKVGDIVTVTGFVSIYNTTKQIAVYEQSQIEVTVSTDPTIIANPTSLTGFTYAEGDGPSEVQSFTISGFNLTKDITLSMEGDYEVSMDANTGYGNGIIFPKDAVTDQTVYVRLKAGLTENASYEGTITLTSEGATTKTVTLAGSVTAAEPTNFIWDLSTDQTTTATTDEMTWVNAIATMAVEKGNSTTPTNNYYPGAPGKTCTSTRFYVRSNLTITPAPGCTITSVVFTATSANYATSFKNSEWKNANVTVQTASEPYTVTVTPTDGTAAISAPIGGTCGFTAVKVYFTGVDIVKGSITDADYATFVSDKKVDFTNSEVKAYTVKIKGNVATLTEIKKVPANTPVVIYKNVNVSGTFVVPVTTDDADDVSDNELKISDGTVTGSNIYILAKPDGEDVGFYALAEDTFVPEGKGYIEYSGAEGVKAFYFEADDATAINEVNGQSSMINGQSIYNLAGQRISKMQKGINIVNGKKILK